MLWQITNYLENIHFIYKHETLNKKKFFLPDDRISSDFRRKYKHLYKTLIIQAKREKLLLQNLELESLQIFQTERSQLVNKRRTKIINPSPRIPPLKYYMFAKLFKRHKFKKNKTKKFHSRIRKWAKPFISLKFMQTIVLFRRLGLTSIQFSPLEYFKFFSLYQSDKFSFSSEYLTGKIYKILSKKMKKKHKTRHRFYQRKVIKIKIKTLDWKFFSSTIFREKYYTFGLKKKILLKYKKQEIKQFKRINFKLGDLKIKSLSKARKSKVFLRQTRVLLNSWVKQKYLYKNFKKNLKKFQVERREKVWTRKVKYIKKKFFQTVTRKRRKKWDVFYFLRLLPKKKKKKKTKRKKYLATPKLKPFFKKAYALKRKKKRPLTLRRAWKLIKKRHSTFRRRKTQINRRLLIKAYWLLKKISVKKLPFIVKLKYFKKITIGKTIIKRISKIFQKRKKRFFFARRVLNSIKIFKRASFLRKVGRFWKVRRYLKRKRLARVRFWVKKLQFPVSKKLKKTTFFYSAIGLSPKLRNITYRSINIYKKVNRYSRKKFKKIKTLLKLHRLKQVLNQSKRLTYRFWNFKKYRSLKKKQFYSYLTNSISKVKFKKPFRKQIVSVRKFVNNKWSLRWVRNSLGAANHLFFINARYHGNFVKKKINFQENISNFAWLNNKSYERYLLKFYFIKKDSLSSHKNIRHKTLFFNFRNKKLKTYGLARKTHWNFFTSKQINERRYQNFLNIFMKKTKSFFYHIFTFFTFKFRLSYKFWSNFNLLYKTFYTSPGYDKQIFQFPLHFDFWNFITQYESDKHKIDSKITFWQATRLHIKRTFWMQQKKKLPKFIKKQIFQLQGIKNCIQYDFITNYFAILKKYKYLTHTNLFIFKNKYLKLHGFRYSY